MATAALDQSLPGQVRVTALRHLPADAMVPDMLRALLSDALPVIRILALEKTEQAQARELMPLVEKLTHDPAVLWDLDDEIFVAKVATRVLAALSAYTGRP